MKYSFGYICFYTNEYFYKIFVLQFDKYVEHKNINIHKKIVVHNKHL